MCWMSPSHSGPCTCQASTCLMSSRLPALHQMRSRRISTRRRSPTRPGQPNVWVLHISGDHLPGVFGHPCPARSRSRRISMRRISPTRSGLCTCQAITRLLPLRLSALLQPRSPRISTRRRSPTRSGPCTRQASTCLMSSRHSAVRVQSRRSSTRRRSPPLSGPCTCQAILHLMSSRLPALRVREVAGYQYAGYRAYGRLPLSGLVRWMFVGGFPRTFGPRVKLRFHSLRPPDLLEGAALLELIPALLAHVRATWVCGPPGASLRHACTHLLTEQTLSLLLVRGDVPACAGIAMFPGLQGEILCDAITGYADV